MARETADQRSLTHDIFHTLSQPLTALQCSLDLALVRDRTAEDLRASIEAALENTERLRQSFLLLRELNDADDPGDISAPVDLRQVLLELQEDFLPVFESAGGRFDLVRDPVHIRGNSAKLRQAFFYLIGYLLGALARPNLSVRVEPREDGKVEVRMTFSYQGSAAEGLCEPVSAGEVEIARRTFQAVGGDLAMVASGSGQSTWIASLQLATRLVLE
jgi:signal transduction histidine kinase